MGRARLYSTFRRFFGSQVCRCEAEAHPAATQKKNAEIGSLLRDAPVRRPQGLAESVAVTLGKQSDSRLLILPGRVHITSNNLHVHYGSVPSHAGLLQAGGSNPSRHAPWLYGFLSGGAATALGFAAYTLGSNQHSPLPQQLQHNQGWFSWPSGWLSIGSAKAADLVPRPDHPAIPYLENPEDQPAHSIGSASALAAAHVAAATPAAAEAGAEAAAPTPAAGAAAAAAEPSQAVLRRSSIAEAAARAAPAVVHLVVTGREQPATALLPHARSSGSGFIFHPDGYILTNAHVVVAALEAGHDKRLMVTLQDGRVFEGSVERLDKMSDLAVVRIAGEEPLPAARLGASGGLRVGEWVVALGSPLLLKHTVTAGIISCVERKGAELGLYSAGTDYIQTDAAVNQGNSGGPLVNLDGEVIGINNMKAVAADGVSFAIPIDTAKDVVRQLRDFGRVIRPYVGMTMAEVNGSSMRRLKQLYPDSPDVRQGVVVSRVNPHSPAAAAGLQPDDVIVSCDGEVQVTIAMLADRFKRRIGGLVELGVLRMGGDGRYQQLAAKVQPVEANNP